MTRKLEENYRMVNGQPRWFVRKYNNLTFTWKDEKSFETKHKAELFINGKLGSYAP